MWVRMVECGRDGDGLHGDGYVIAEEVNPGWFRGMEW